MQDETIKYNHRPSLRELIDGLTNDLTTLLRQEIRLARTEVVGKVSQATRGVIGMVVGGLLAYTSLAIVIIAAALGYGEFLPLWLSSLLLGLLMMILGVMIIQVGRTRLRQPRVAPSRTVASGRKGKASMWQVLKETVSEWMEDEASQLAAALSYYTAVSIAPLLVLVVVIVGLFLGRQAAQGEVMGRIQNTMGAEGAQFLAIVLENADQPTLASTAGILSFLVLIWGSTNVFGQLQNSLNKIWDVKVKPGRGIWGTIQERLLSFTMVLGIAFLLLVSLVISSALSVLSNMGQAWLPGSDWVWQVVNVVVSFAVTIVLFAAIYRILPDAEIAWRDVWPGAVVTALLFTIGKLVLGWYLGNAGSAYGVVGSLVVFLLWVYYSAQILFLGAEFTQVYARRYGAGIQPSKNAVRLDSAPATKS